MGQQQNKVYGGDQNKVVLLWYRISNLRGTFRYPCWTISWMGSTRRPFRQWEMWSRPRFHLPSLPNRRERSPLSKLSTVIRYGHYTSAQYARCWKKWKGTMSSRILAFDLPREKSTEFYRVWVVIPTRHPTIDIIPATNQKLSRQGRWKQGGR